MNETHLITAEDIEGLDMVEILMEAKSVIDIDSSVEIEGYGTFTYNQLEDELAVYGY